MKKIISALLIAVLVSSTPGCATLKNTRMPEEFTDLGICPVCRQIIAVDGFSGNEIALCPECSSDFLVKDAKGAFRKKCVDLKNRKTMISVATIALIAASVAGAIYGIPIPIPPLDEDTFRPFELPLAISARRAAQPPLSEPAPETVMEMPAIRPPGDVGLSMPRILAGGYGFYESPYSVVITDMYRGDGYAEDLAPYDVSMGRIEGARYDVEYISNAYQSFAAQHMRRALR